MKRGPKALPRERKSMRKKTTKPYRRLDRAERAAIERANWPDDEGRPKAA